MAMRDQRTLAVRNEGTEVIDPYEPPEDPAYDWEYDDEPAYRRGPRVIWGRLAALGVFLLLAFLIGRASGGGGIPQEDLDAARAERNDAQAQVAGLQEEITDLERQNTGLQDRIDQLEAEETTTPPADETGEDQPAGDNYTIEEGDTLTTLAIEFYDDASLDQYIAEANDIADPSLINTGDVIIIPPDPNP